MLGVCRYGAGKCAAMVPESDARSAVMVPESDARNVPLWCRNAMLGVCRYGAGKRCSECAAMVPESVPLCCRKAKSGACRKAMLGMCRNGAGK